MLLRIKMKVLLKLVFLFKSKYLYKVLENIEGKYYKKIEKLGRVRSYKKIRELLIKSVCEGLLDRKSRKSYMNIDRYFGDPDDVQVVLRLLRRKYRRILSFQIYIRREYYGSEIFVTF